MRPSGWTSPCTARSPTRRRRDDKRDAPALTRRQLFPPVDGVGRCARDSRRREGAPRRVHRPGVGGGHVRVREPRGSSRSDDCPRPDRVGRGGARPHGTSRCRRHGRSRPGTRRLRSRSRAVWGSVLPVAGIPLHALAALVAYSRVHTGVHYPGRRARRRRDRSDDRRRNRRRARTLDAAPLPSRLARRSGRVPSWWGTPPAPLRPLGPCGSRGRRAVARASTRTASGGSREVESSAGGGGLPRSTRWTRSARARWISCLEAGTDDLRGDRIQVLTTVVVDPGRCTPSGRNRSRGRPRTGWSLNGRPASIDASSITHAPFVGRIVPTFCSA